MYLVLLPHTAQTTIFALTLSHNPANNRKQAIVSQKDLNLIWRIIKANWWVPLLVLPVFYAIGAFYIYKLTPVYKASTEFLVQANDEYYKNNVLSDASFVNYNAYIDNSNETRILKSYDLASQVVNRLIDEIQVSYYIVGKVRTTEYFRNMPFKVKVNTINSALYEKVFDFQVLNAREYKISYELNGDNKEITGRFNEDLLNLDLPIRVEWAANYSEKSAAALNDILYQFSIHSKDFLISTLRYNLSVTNPEFTRILKLDLLDVIPDRAVVVLDTLNQVYAERKLKSKYELNERTVEYIDKQLDEIRFSLKSIQDTMQSYKRSKSIINLEWQQQDFLSKISTYDGQRSELQLQLGALQDLEKYIVEDRDPQFLPPSVFVFEKAGFLNTATQELFNKQIELNKASSTARETNPIVSSLKESIKRTKQDLLIYISNTRKATQKQIENVNAEILAYINEAKLIPGKQQDVMNIQRQATVSEQLYNFLLEKKASTKIARASIVSDVKIVEAPRYAGIDSPDKSKISKQFLSLGLLVSLILIAVRLFFYSRIRTLEHLKEVTSLPVIGVLPKVKAEESQGVVVDTAPSGLMAEAFRNFRTNLQYASVDNQAKTYLVTSYLPGEGKTFTSTNLAAMLAKSGRKTVLIELDLHKPSVYKRLGLSAPEKGLTTAISGQHSYEEIVQQTQIPNLHCIFAGPIPPNPSEFVLSQKLQDFITRAKNDFDFVIIDTPPAGLLSDSLYLIQYADASIFVLNTRSTNKKVVNFVEEVIAANNLKHVHLLLNGVVNAKRKYYYQGYGYSYGYGYGYGYGRGKVS